MLLIRWCAAAAVWIAALLAIHRTCWLPYRADVAVPRLLSMTEQAAEETDPAEAAILARETLADVLRVREFWPGDIRLDMLAGANSMTLGRHEAALEYYRHALTLDQRPEIYVALAQAELALGRRADAIADYATAIEFNPGYAGVLEGDPVTLSDVQAAIAARKAAVARKGAGGPRVAR